MSKRIDSGTAEHDPFPPLPKFLPACDRIVAHYCHAVEKRPYFCDYLIPSPYSLIKSSDAANEISALLYSYRKDLAIRARNSTVTAKLVLNCELYEVYEAIARKDTAAAVAECYDCIAVLLRIIDVLEGRQELGKQPKPKTKGVVNNERA